MSATVAVAAILAASLMAVQAADVSDNCNGTCVHGNGTFCGTDGLCHQFSCATWYQYGPQNFTGYTNSAASLSCQRIPETVPGSSEVFQSSVSFRCRSLTPSPIAMGFRRKCMVNHSGTRAMRFTCYDLAESTSADFSTFLSRVGSGLNCTDSQYDETGYPKFTYSVAYTHTYNVADSFPGETVLTEGFNGTSEFDAARATGGTLYSIYEERETQAPTPVPTPSPTTSIDGSTSFPKKWLPIFVAVGAFLVHWPAM